MDKHDEISSLNSMMITYENATNSHDFSKVSQLILPDAVYWFSEGSFIGIKSIQKAFENAWNAMPDEIYSIKNVRWFAVGKSEASCVYDFFWKGTLNGKFKEGKGRGTNILVKPVNKWKIIHEHLSSII